MRTMLFFVILFIMCGCGSRNENKVRVFIASDYKEGTHFKLWVDDTLRSEGKFKRGHKSPYYFRMMAVYIEKSDSLRTFRIKMEDKDTTFVHDMKGIDKISISVLSDKGFLIFDSNDKNAWLLN